ncbi:hypothetical protein NLJ89_g8725 [Agrocybe chaxingu]|uniref:SUN domain-containing protein n=1 Tax=Agrocybe chaxingu TaxID=84603 RepID=A0A9W8MRW7_9AGAR|nr:hypothetical protein NLJ89_g8725 [Agrocybe chaxingu]
MDEAESKQPVRCETTERQFGFSLSASTSGVLFSCLLAFLSVAAAFYASAHGSELNIQVGNLEQALHNFTRDGLGFADLASRYNGGHVLLSLTTPSVPHNAGKYVTPFSVLEGATTLHPGQCWLIHGSSGQFGIEFRRAATISHISIDHIAKELSFDISNAPKEALIWGILDRRSTTGTHKLAKTPTNIYFMGKIRDRPFIEDRRSTFVPIATVKYDIYDSNFIQTFSIFSGLDSISFDGVVVEILGNWGGDTTCLYRIRVHGRPFQS